MKHNLYYSVMALAMTALGATSCSNEEGLLPDVKVGEKTNMTVTVSLEGLDDNTRSIMTENSEGKLKFAWKSGDKLLVTGELGGIFQHLGTLTLDEKSDGQSKGTFTGGVDIIGKKGTYHYFYLGEGTVEENAKKYETTIPDNALTDKSLGINDIQRAKAEMSYSEDGLVGEVALKRAFGFLTLTVNLPSDVTIPTEGVNLTLTGTGITSKATIDLTDAEASVTKANAESNSVTLKMTGESSKKFYLNILPGELGNLSVSTEINGVTYSATVLENSSVTTVANKNYTATFNLEATKFFTIRYFKTKDSSEPIETIILPYDNSINGVRWDASQKEMTVDMKYVKDNLPTVSQDGYNLVNWNYKNGSDIAISEYSSFSQTTAKESGYNFDFYAVWEEELEEWVDLGLESGILWRNRNLGSETIYEYGNLIGWGDGSMSKTSTSTRDYPCPFNMNETYYQRNYFENCTGKSIYDVATHQMGSGIYTPDTNDWDELFENCTGTYETLTGTDGNSINVLKLTSDINGKFIYLPLAGYRLGENIATRGVKGYYWSAVFCLWFGGQYHEKSGVYYMIKEKNEQTIEQGNIQTPYGMSIRPIKY